MRKFTSFLTTALLISLSLQIPSINAQNVPLTKGFHHIGLTVSDLEASTAFFTDTLGWKLLGKDTKYPATFVSDQSMMIALWQAKDPENAVPFDRRHNIGLHHLAISVESFDALYKLHKRVSQTPGVVIEFPPEPAYGGPSKHMMLREPSGNRLEFRHTPNQ